MVTKKQFTSRELILHPGETLSEILEERGLSQKEIAIRTDVSEKHISNVINGKSNITSEFAMKLAIALNGDASFWINLQANYDFELFMLNQANSISDEERAIAEEVKVPVEIFLKTKIPNGNKDEVIYRLRKILGVNTLKSIASLHSGFYRRQSTIGTSENVMYVWQYLCEKEVENQEVHEFDTKRLRQRLPYIKKIMFEDSTNHIDLIQKELNECGVYFTVNTHVPKAPINGLTVKTKRNHAMIALTIRGKWIDVFWFTLFHEIAHVLSGEYLKDVSPEENAIHEKRADKFAQDILIAPELYEVFLAKKDFSKSAIKQFSNTAGVLPTIVIGRLMKDKVIPWSKINQRDKYTWSE